MCVFACRQLLCRHHKVYYPVRQHLVQHMVTSMQRLGLSSNATIEQRKLAVDLAEVIIKWEFQRVSDLGLSFLYLSIRSLILVNTVEPLIKDPLRKGQLPNKEHSFWAPLLAFEERTAKDKMASPSLYSEILM